MAFDTGRNLIWQVAVGGDNGIYGIDPSDGSVEQVITGSPWGNISQRGLAYDPAADVFYIGGWNEGIVYKRRRPVAADARRDAQPVQPARLRRSPASPGTAPSGCSGRRPTPTPTRSGCSIR